MLLQGKKPLYHRFWVRNILKYKNKGNLLDLGCGMGFFLEYASNSFDVYGLDISKYGVVKTKKRVSNVKVCIGDATRIGFKDNYFDIITCFDIIEHLENPKDLFKECFRLMKDNSYLIITTPNISSIGHEVKGNEWFGYRDSTHISLFENIKWINMIKSSGFDIAEVFYDGLWDTPYYSKVPDIIQNIMIKYPSVVLFWLGFKFSQKYGENLCIIAKKPVT